MAAGGVVWTLFLNKITGFHRVCALSDHGARKTKSHAIMQLRRNREGLRRPLRACRSLLDKVKKYIIVYRFCAHQYFFVPKTCLVSWAFSATVSAQFAVYFVIFRYLSVSFGTFL